MLETHTSDIDRRVKQITLFATPIAVVVAIISLICTVVSVKISIDEKAAKQDSIDLVSKRIDRLEHLIMNSAHQVPDAKAPFDSISTAAGVGGAKNEAPQKRSKIPISKPIRK
jgi:hypothetical protein